MEYQLARTHKFYHPLSSLRSLRHRTRKKGGETCLLWARSSTRSRAWRHLPLLEEITTKGIFFIRSVTVKVTVKMPNFCTNSIEFAKEVVSQYLQYGEIMLSFDIVSSFTNVLIRLATDIIEKRLRDDATLTSCTSLIS